MRSFLLIFLVVFAVGSAQSQVRKKRTPAQTSSSFITQHFVGPIVQLNNISGVEWEMTMKNNSGSSSKSTFSIIGGYASRYSKIDYIETFHDTIIIKTQKTQWIHGLGAAIVLNNYIKSYKEGPYWSVGASGNYFFRKGIATELIGATDVSYYKSGNLKIFSVFLEGGYKYNLSVKYTLKPSIGIGIMGSPFRSSSASAINGFFFQTGCSLLFKS